MNKIETIVYNAVRKNPALKQFVRNCYQTIFDLLPRKKEFFSGDFDFKEGYFFGFHDVSPLSMDEKRLLAMQYPFDLRMPRPEEPLTIGYFDFNNGKLGQYHELGKSYAWNFHKGCRLQWMDNNRIIFNTARNGKLGAEIIDCSNGSQQYIDYPIDAIFVKDGKEMASSFSYERLERCMPGYGYPYHDDGEINKSAPEDTGLYLVNLSSGERKLLLSIRDIAIKVTDTVENEYLHFVTHTEFSPDGKYLSFLYRRIPREGDYMKRRSVMCVYSFESEKLIVLPSQESGSHYVWNNRHQIIASCNIDGKNCHALFDMNNLSEVVMIDSDHLNSDGHQSFIDDNRFVTDTYPDKYRMAKLYLADIQSDSSKLIGSLYSPKKFQTKDFHCHIACDLHPRVLAGGKYVCFDSPRTGKRGIYVMTLK